MNNDEEPGFSLEVQRHADKLKPDEKRVPLEESGLTPAQQAKWKEACERLGIPEPEITYESLPEIEERAQKLYRELPNDALVLLSSTKIARARFTADFLGSELMRLAAADNRDIQVEFLDPEVAFLENYPEAMEKNREVATELEALDREADSALKDWAKTTGSTAHPREQEIVFHSFNRDLVSNDSFLRRRAEQLRERIDALAEKFKGRKGWVHIIGVGHHSNLIALDVAVNDRRKYDSVDEIPKPLEAWRLKWPPSYFGERLK